MGEGSLYQEGGLGMQASLQAGHALYQHVHSLPTQHHVCQPHHRPQLDHIQCQGLHAIKLVMTFVLKTMQLGLWPDLARGAMKLGTVQTGLFVQKRTATESKAVK